MIEIVRFRSVEDGAAVMVECAFSGEDVITEPTDDGGVKSTVRRAYVLLPEMYSEAGLKKGPITVDVWETLMSDSEKSRALFTAQKLLGYASKSAKALEFKLKTKGFSKEAAEFAVQRILNSGEIDESGDAVRLAERLAASGKGRMRILSELRAKSFGAEALSAAAGYLNTVDFSLICRSVINKKWGKFPKEPDLKRKAVASLMRLGFSSSDIRKALDRD